MLKGRASTKTTTSKGRNKGIKACQPSVWNFDESIADTPVDNVMPNNPFSCVPYEGCDSRHERGENTGGVVHEGIDSRKLLQKHAERVETARRETGKVSPSENRCDHHSVETENDVQIQKLSSSSTPRKGRISATHANNVIQTPLLKLRLPNISPTLIEPGWGWCDRDDNRSSS